MSVASYCRRPASTVEPDESLRSAAQRIEKEGIGCLVVASGDKAIGVLSVYTNRQYQFSEDEIELMEAIGGHCALAIRNASDEVTLSSARSGSGH
jgi:GAF domain-containing protein